MASEQPKLSNDELLQQAKDLATSLTSQREVLEQKEEELAIQRKARNRLNSQKGNATRNLNRANETLQQDGLSADKIKELNEKVEKYTNRISDIEALRVPQSDLCKTLTAHLKDDRKAEAATQQQLYDIVQKIDFDALQQTNPTVVSKILALVVTPATDDAATPPPKTKKTPLTAVPTPKPDPKPAPEDADKGTKDPTASSDDPGPAPLPSEADGKIGPEVAPLTIQTAAAIRNGQPPAKPNGKPNLRVVQATTASKADAPNPLAVTAGTPNPAGDKAANSDRGSKKTTASSDGKPDGPSKAKRILAAVTDKAVQKKTAAADDKKATGADKPDQTGKDKGATPPEKPSLTNAFSKRGVFTPMALGAISGAALPFMAVIACSTALNAVTPFAAPTVGFIVGAGSNIVRDWKRNKNEGGSLKDLANKTTFGNAARAGAVGAVTAFAVGAALPADGAVMTAVSNFFGEASCSTGTPETLLGTVSPETGLEVIPDAEPAITDLDILKPDDVIDPTALLDLQQNDHLFVTSLLESAETYGVEPSVMEPLQAQLEAGFDFIDSASSVEAMGEFNTLLEAAQGAASEAGEAVTAEEYASILTGFIEKLSEADFVTADTDLNTFQDSYVPSAERAEVLSKAAELRASI